MAGAKKRVDTLYKFSEIVDELGQALVMNWISKRGQEYRNFLC